MNEYDDRQIRKENAFTYQLVDSLLRFEIPDCDGTCKMCPLALNLLIENPEANGEVKP